MSPSLRALLTGIIDYAGLFPPANLPLDQAIRHYARYRTEPESWMLARFVCPAKRLVDMQAHRRDSPEALSLSVLGSDVDIIPARASVLLNNLFALRLCRNPERQAHVDTFEVRISATVFDDTPDGWFLTSVVQEMAEQVDTALAGQRLPLV